MTQDSVPAAAMRRSFCAALALTFATALPATAQRAREEGQLATERRGLEQRDREVLHQGDPLQLVGIGAGDPDVLARTPALAGATLGLVHVDRDELRARKLAMYESSARFDLALRSNEVDRRAAQPDPTLRVAQPTTRVGPDVSDAGPTVWPWVAGSLVLLVSLLARAALARERGPAATRKS